MPSAPTSDPTPPQYTRPDYAGAFRCIASACEDTCCTGWTIPIDRLTYNRYQADSVLSAFTPLLVLNPQPTDADTAHMPLTHAGTCAFLDRQNLCGIHHHFGSGKLSYACNAYPRERTDRFGAVENALNLSCPEAARLMLFNPALLGPGFTQAALPGRLTALIAPPSANCDPLLAIREFCLLLLADRSYSLPRRLERMGTLAAMLQQRARADQLDPAEWAARNPRGVASVLRQTLEVRTTGASVSSAPSSISPGRIPPANSFQSDVPMPSLTSAAGDAARQLHFAHAILRRRLADSPISLRFRICLDQVEQGLHLRFTDPAIHPASIAAYASASAGWLTPFLRQHPHLLENLIANHIFKYHYPFGRQPENSLDPVENHTFLCTQVALLQTLLVGIAAQRGHALSPVDVVTLVQTLSRAVEHRRPTLEAIASLTRLHGLDNPVALRQLLQLPLTAPVEQPAPLSRRRLHLFNASLDQIAC